MSPVYVYGYGRRKHILDPDCTDLERTWEKALCGAYGGGVSTDPAYTESVWPTCKHCERAWAKRAAS